MAAYTDNKKFADAILPQYLLDEAIQWIQSNMEPEDVFSNKQLEQWAIDSGYVSEP